MEVFALQRFVFVLFIVFIVLIDWLHNHANTLIVQINWPQYIIQTRDKYNINN